MAISTFGLELLCDEIQSASTISLFITVSLLFIIYLSSKTTKNEPPIDKGWIPWLGCAISMGEKPLQFIEQKRKELGPVFSLFAAGEKMTFITDPNDFQYIFHATNVDFQKAVLPSLSKIACLDEELFYKYHSGNHGLVKGKLATQNLPEVAQHLSLQFNAHIDNYFQIAEKQDLMQNIKSSMYSGVMNNLFGDNKLPVNSKIEFDKLLEQFSTYDDQFERGAKLPSFLLPKWTKARNYLLSTMRSIVTDIQTNPSSTGRETVLDKMVAYIDKDDDVAANYAILFLWASLANAIPFTFWSLVYILNNKEVEYKLRQELNRVFKGRFEDGDYQVSEEDVKQIPYLKWCVLETIRIQSVGIITRRVVKEFTIRDYVIEEGSLLMLSPHWANRNETSFPQANIYNPDRWAELNVDKNVFPKEFVAFGGGRYQCPGRWFALLEMQIYIALFLLKFDCEVHSDIPTAQVRGLPQRATRVSRVTKPET